MPHLYLVLCIWIISSYEGTAKLVAPKFDCKNITWATDSKRTADSLDRQKAWVNVDPLVNDTVIGLKKGDIAQGLVCYFVDVNPVVVQLWKPFNATGEYSRYELVWKQDINPDWSTKDAKKAMGYRKIINIAANKKTMEAEDHFGIASSDGSGMSVQQSTVMSNKMHLADYSKMLPGHSSLRFDSLAIPRQYQCCFCKETDCRDKLGTKNTDSGVVEFPALEDDGKGEEKTTKKPNTGGGPIVVQPGPKTGAASDTQEGLLSHEAIIGIMLWLGVLTLLMMIVLAVLMVICVSNKKTPRDKSRLSTSSESTSNLKDVNGDWNSPGGWQPGDQHAI